MFTSALFFSSHRSCRKYVALLHALVLAFLESQGNATNTMLSKLILLVDLMILQRPLLSVYEVIEVRHLITQLFLIRIFIITNSVLYIFFFIQASINILMHDAFVSITYLQPDISYLEFRIHVFFPEFFRV